MVLGEAGGSQDSYELVGTESFQLTLRWEYLEDFNQGQTLWNKPGFIHGQTYILEVLVTGLWIDYSQKLTII